MVNADEGFKHQFGFPSPLSLQTINMEYGTSNTAYLGVGREELIYLSGNEKIDLKIEDCFPWEQASMLADKCSNKCLPVVTQSIFEERIDLMKCHNPIDHQCMLTSWLTEVST